MAGSNNFLQWDVAKANIQSDVVYEIESSRTGGAIAGLFEAKLANKLFYQVTTMVAALGQSLSNKGYVVSDSDIAALIVILSNILTKADFGNSAGTVCQGNDDRLNSPGMRTWFGQNTAPSGWTIDATAADGLIAVKGGAQAYNVAGGGRAGTWTQPDHALIENEMPIHSHLIAGATGDPYGHYYNGYMGGTIVSEGAPSGNTGGGLAHNHGITYRPLANVGIVAIKD